MLANPYSVPPMARQALLRLTHFVSDPSPICDAVKLVLADFQRTHRDEWFRHKQAFTPEELEDLDGVMVTAKAYFS